MKKSLLSLLTVAALVLAPACCMDRCEKPCNPRPACPKKECCPKKCPKVCKKRCKPTCEQSGYSDNVSNSTSNGYASNNRAKKTTTRKVAAGQSRVSKKA